MFEAIAVSTALLTELPPCDSNREQLGCAVDAVTTRVPDVEPLQTSLSLGAMQDAVEEATTSAVQKFGTAETWRFQIQFAGGVDLSESEDIFGLGGIGFSYFMADDLSLDFELNGLYFDQRNHSQAYGLNGNILFRWHFYKEVNWSLYLDAGAGVMGTTDEVPQFGTHFNFTPQAGGGVSFDINAETRGFVGVRWHHVSNASTSSDNPGKDSVEAYFMLSYPF